MARWLLTTFVLLLSFRFLHAQSQAHYKSSSDDLVTVRSISLLPIFDNLHGIYARPIEGHILTSLKQAHKFEFREVNTLGPLTTPDELEQSPDILGRIADGVSADAFIATSITKGPSGITLKMNLFLKSDKSLLAQEVVPSIQKLDIDSLKSVADSTLKLLLVKIPYGGVVLSRQGTRVTVNLGRRDGITDDQIVSAIQIIKLNRHPKFNFLVSTEKEIIGKIKILKADDTLSFGRIVTEKEAGSIQANTKLGFLESISYANTDSLTEGDANKDTLPLRPDGKIAYGNNPQEWVPKKNPTFGAVGARIGLGQFQENIQDTTALESSAPFYPVVTLGAEIWLTPEWSIHSELRQGIVSTDDPTGSGELARSLSSSELLFGYNLRLMETLNSPKIEALFGYSTYRMSSDTSSLSTKVYSGLKFGVAGAYPLTAKKPTSIGAHLHFMLNPSVKETPTASGSSDSTVNTFGAFLDRTLSINVKARAQVDFELYSSDFSGGTVTSASQKHTTFSVGAYYLF